MKSRISVRDYRPEDAQALAEIFFNTIHRINIKDYTQEQVDVWAPDSSLEEEGWKKKFLRTNPIVAVVEDKVVGFAEFEPNGHIDCFYCHHEWIGRGVGSALMSEIFRRANNSVIDCIFSEVSITAKPFFEKQGFIVLSEQTILRKGVELTNYKMEKRLCKNAEGGLVNTAEIIAEYYKAMGQRDFEKLEKLLSSDVQFIGPLAKMKGKEAVIEATKRFSSLFKTLNVRAKFGSNNQAMVVYDLDCPDPIGLFSSSALMTFENGLITKIELFYDARPFDKR